MDEPALLQSGPETFRVLLGEGRELTAILPHDARSGLGLQGVPPLTVAREIVRFLMEHEDLGQVDEPLPLVAMAARHPGFVDELRARLV